MPRKIGVHRLFVILIRLRVTSDLHLDSYRRAEATLLVSRLFGEGDYDVAVLAGDVANFPSLDRSLPMVLRAIPAHIPIVYVPGNHEHYQAEEEAQLDALVTSLGRENLHFLRERSITLKGLRFLGTTMWYRHGEAVKAIVRERNWPDFRWIPYIDESLDRWNARDEEALDRGLGSADIVVSHMLPHPACVSPRYEGSDTNVFFVNDQSARLEALRSSGGKLPRVWLFGHTHEWIDTEREGVRFFARPMGYRKEYPERNAAVDLADQCTVTLRT